MIIAGVLFIGIILAFLVVAAIYECVGEKDDMMTNEYYNSKDNSKDKSDDDNYAGDIWS